MDLFRAVSFSYWDALKEILTFENPNIVNDNGETPLALACGITHPGINLKIRVVKLLLKKGASINAPSGRLRSTALHYAVQGQQIEIIEVLLRWKADVNVRNIENTTPLHLACGIKSVTNYYIHSAIVKILLKHNADANAVDDEGKTPLMIALELSHKHLISLLLQHRAGVDFMDLHGVTPLMLACRNFELETIQQILNQNPLANCADRSNSTALHYLSKTSFREDTHVVAETLLKLNVDVNAKDSHGTTALCYACENLCYNLVETLVLNGADVCFRDKKRRTILHMIASWPQKYSDGAKLVKLCVSKGAGKLINFRDRCSSTALMTAIRDGKEAVALALVECGADVSLFDHSEVYFETRKCCHCVDHTVDVHMTLLNVAVKHENLQVIDIVFDSGKNVNVNQTNDRYIDSPIYFAVNNDDIWTAKMLMAAGFKYNEYPHNASILHTVVCSNNYQLTNLLLEYGVDVEERNQWTHQTALSDAHDRKLMDICELLVKYQSKEGYIAESDYACPCLRTFSRNCHYELELMKREIVYENVSLYELWSRKLDEKIFQWLRNQNLWNFLKNYKSCEMKAKYCNYEKVIRFKFQLLTEMKAIYDYAELSLRLFLNKYFGKLPLEMIELMMKEFSIRHMRRMSCSLSRLTPEFRKTLVTHPEKTKILDLRSLAEFFETSSQDVDSSRSEVLTDSTDDEDLN